VGLKRAVFLVLGIVNVALGVAGILLPLLPTTPFLLLAAYLFARSSDRWHNWLLSQKHLGPYIHAFRDRTGLTRTQKLRIGSSITVVMAISIYFAPLNAVRVVCAAFWLFWTVMLIRMKTCDAQRQPAT